MAKRWGGLDGLLLSEVLLLLPGKKLPRRFGQAERGVQPCLVVAGLQS